MSDEHDANGDNLGTSGEVLLSYSFANGDVTITGIP